MADVKNDFARLNASFRDECTYQSSESYVNKMKQLLGEHSTQSGVYNLYFDNDKNLEIPVALKGYVPDGKGGVRLVLPYTLMHRIGTLHSKDGHRLYEFLIEYDVELPSVGIYYGCRGVTVDGFDHAQEIEHFRHDYDMVKTEICRVLNNTFLDKDFSHRLKLTDNANDGTYWLFWITLNEEEDICDVGVNATTMIRNVFKRYLDGEEFSNVAVSEKQNKKERMCFTNATYNALLDKMKYYDIIDGEKRVNEEKSKKVVTIFKRFLKKVQQDRVMIKDPSYECAYRVLHAIDKEECSAADFARMMYAFFDYLSKKEVFNKDESKLYVDVPWAALCKVFLDNDGNAFQPDYLRTQLNMIKNAKRRDFETEIKELSCVIKSWCDS